MRVSDFVTTSGAGASNFPLVRPSNHIGPQRVTGGLGRMNPRTSRTTTTLMGFGEVAGPDKGRIWTWADLQGAGYVGPQTITEDIKKLVGVKVKMTPGEAGWLGKVQSDDGKTFDMRSVDVIITGGYRDALGRLNIMIDHRLGVWKPADPLAAKDESASRPHHEWTNVLLIEQIIATAWWRDPIKLGIAALAGWWLLA